MNRVFMEGWGGAASRGESLTIEGEVHRHLVKALRAREGERFLATDGAGRELFLEVASVGKRETQVTVLDHRRVQAGPGARVTLAVAPPKGSRLDVAVEKSCEIGVGRIVPILTARSIVTMDGDSARLERWRHIARSAMVQSGQSWEAAIEAPRTLDGMLKGTTMTPAPRLLFAHLAQDAIPIVDALRVGEDGDGEVAILVGPEGGFTDEEAERALGAGATIVTLGETKLRTETAAVVAVALTLEALRVRAGSRDSFETEDEHGGLRIL